MAACKSSTDGRHGGSELPLGHKGACAHISQCFTLCAWGCLCEPLRRFSTLKARGASASKIKEEAGSLQLSFCSPLGSPVICILDVN